MARRSVIARADGAIPIRFGRLGPLFVLLGMSKLSSHITVGDDEVTVRMSWAFATTFPRSSVREATVESRHVWWSIGVHGWRGTWLVNGSADGIAWIHLDPTARARVLGIPVRLRRLGVSVDSPDALCARLLAPPATPVDEPT